MSTRALVTGAGGFIGRRLVDALADRGWQVRALVRTPRPLPSHVDVVRGDLLDGETMRRAVTGIDVVFHLASKVHDLEEVADTGAHDAVTVVGTSSLVDACRDSGVRAVVFASSLSVYGPTGSGCVADDAPLHPDTPYGRAKLQAETLLHEWGRASGVHVCSLRPAMVYGPGCKGNLVRMVRAIDRGLFPPLPDTGNRRSLVGVDDVTAAFLLAAEHPAARDRRYTLTDGKPCSTRAMYEAICRELGRPIPRWHIPLWALRAGARAGDLIGAWSGRRFPLDSRALDRLTGSAWFDSSRIERELGFAPVTSFDRGAADVVRAYREARDETSG